MTREQAVTGASFATPLLLSLAANVVWGVSTGSAVLIVAGLATPLLLALAVERFYALGHVTGHLRTVQVAGMSVVALVAAAWSWVHTTELLLAYLPPVTLVPAWVQPMLCVVAPLAVDGLAVLSVLSLGAARAQTPATVTLGTGTGTGTASAPKTPGTAEPPARRARAQRDRMQSWGGPDTVTTPSGTTVPVTTDEVSQARDRARVPGQRTKRQLEARLRELGLSRRANELVPDLRARVEAAERAQTTDEEVPA